MKKTIYESELKVMEILWEEGDTSAKELAIKLNESTGWSTTTTYTVIKKCIEKGLIERGSKFMCHALITRKKAQQNEAEILVEKMFGGSSDLLLASLLGGKNINSSQVKALRNMIQNFMAQ